MKVCYFGTYDRFNPRNEVMLSSLRENSVEVIECHADLWTSTAEKVSLAKRGFRGGLSFVFKAVVKYLQLVGRYAKVGPHDVLMVGYAGHVDMFLAKLLALLTGKPLVFDAYQSLHDTLVYDRRLTPERSFKARLAGFADRWSCALADVVLLDTETHIEHFCAKFGLPREKFRRVFISADSDIFSPRTVDGQDGLFKVVYFGAYVPLHGTDLIVRAAQKLADYKEISFELIGQGQTYAQTKALADELGVHNVSFVQWLSHQELASYLAQADVCLGIFGTGQKVDWVIPSKVYVALAMKRPVITGDSPAVREVLLHGETALLCERGNPDALAEAIHLLWKDKALRDKIAEQGYELFSRRLSPAAIGCDLREVLENVVRERDR